MAETVTTGGTQGTVTVSRRELERTAKALAGLSQLLETALSQKQGATEKKACQEARGLTAMIRDQVYRWEHG